MEERGRPGGWTVPGGSGGMGLAASGGALELLSFQRNVL